MATIESTGLRYDTLSIERNEIRILVLLAGRWVDDVRCKLITRSLDDKPLFHALSYSWGHHSERCKISVNGKTLNVSLTLESALRRIRQEDQSLAIWIDKICINQSDEAEKASQVRQMHQIYRQCSNALIWLGNAEEPVEVAKKHELLRRWSTRSSIPATPFDGPGGGVLRALAACFSCTTNKRFRYRKLPAYDEEALEDPFAMIMHFAADKHISELPCFLPSRWNKQRLCFKETRRFRSMWLRFRQLLETPWHGRFWCTQEALLPTNAWVLYGSRRIPFTTIMRALRNQRRHLCTCCSEVEKLFPMTYAFCPDSLYLTPPPPTHDLDALLRMFRYKDCRDPRDKVFGIWALFDGRVEVQQVDYGLSTAQVYINAARLILDNCAGNLRCLTGRGFGAEGLPSWTRDLKQTPNIAQVQAEMRRRELYDLYNAGGSDDTGSFLSLEKGRLLHLAGQPIDRIKTICLPLDIPIEQIDTRYALQVLLSWRKAASAITPITLIFPTLHDDDESQASFWRTIIADTIWDPSTQSFRRFEPATDTAVYEKWLRRMLIDWVTFRKPVVDDRFVQALLCAAFGRTFFVTEKGRMGLCYDNARVGDEVWVLRGGRVPFVLRRQGDGLGLVCDSFCYGVMDGQDTDRGEWEDVILG